MDYARLRERIAAEFDDLEVYCRGVRNEELAEIIERIVREEIQSSN